MVRILVFLHACFSGVYVGHPPWATFWNIQSLMEANLIGPHCHQELSTRNLSTSEGEYFWPSLQRMKCFWNGKRAPILREALSIRVLLWQCWEYVNSTKFPKTLFWVSVSIWWGRISHTDKRHSSLFPYVLSGREKKLTNNHWNLYMSLIWNKFHLCWQGLKEI